MNCGLGGALRLGSEVPGTVQLGHEDFPLGQEDLVQFPFPFLYVHVQSFDVERAAFQRLRVILLYCIAWPLRIDCAAIAQRLRADCASIS